MGTCQNDWLVTGPLAHTHCIPRYIGYVTEGGFREIPKIYVRMLRDFGHVTGWRFKRICNRRLWARNATTPVTAIIIGIIKGDTTSLDYSSCEAGRDGL